MKLSKVKTLIIVLVLALVCTVTTSIALAMEKEEAPQTRTVITYVPKEDAKNVEKWIKVEREGEIYLITENLDCAYLWNSQHSLLPHMYFEVYDENEILNLEELLENAENFYDTETSVEYFESEDVNPKLEEMPEDSNVSHEVQDEPVVYSENEGLTLMPCEEDTEILVLEHSSDGHAEECVDDEVIPDDLLNERFCGRE